MPRAQGVCRAHLEVVHGRDGPVGGPPLVPLPECVPGLRAEQPRRLLLLEVLDEGQGSIGAGQVVASWRGRTSESSRVLGSQSRVVTVLSCDSYLYTAVPCTTGL